MAFASRYLRPLVPACVLASLGCAGAPVETPVVTKNLGVRSGPLLEGTARVPTGRTLDTEVPLVDAPVYLTTPGDEFYRANGKTLGTTTDARGGFRLVNGVPAGVPVIVSASLEGDRRVVGFTVPEDEGPPVELSVASTYVTEFLRARSAREGKSMADYPAASLTTLVAATRQAIAAGRLAVPDLAIRRVAEMNRAYGLAVGQNVNGLGDAWAKLLGRRVLALVTVAGSGELGFAGDGGAAKAAAFYRPHQAVVDADGNMVLADEGNHRIRRVDVETGEISTVAGTGEAGFSGDGGPALEAQLRGPRAIAIDAERNLYIADAGNGRVRKVDGITGDISTVVGGVVGWDGDGGAATEAKIAGVRGLALDAMGNVFFSDTQNEGSVYHTVRKLNVRSGLISTVAGVPLVVGAFGGDGGPATSARLNYPQQLAFDGTGRLLIADTDNHCLRRIDFSNGLISTVAGMGGQAGNDPDGKQATETRISTPHGVAVAPDGTIFFSERDPGRVRVILPDGKLRTLAGGGTDPSDGEALMVKLSEPHDLTVERDGNLLVADTRGSRIRRIVTQFGF